MLRTLFLITLLLFPSSVLAVATDYTDPVSGMKFVLVQRGTFVMGSSDDLKTPYSQPPHQVTLDDFYIGKFEVTFAQYDQFCDATGVTKPADEAWGRGDRPVINVSWDDAVSYTQWLSTQSGRSFRLPTEAEWEFAYRGGTTSRYWWGEEWAKRKGNCNGCGTEWDNKQTAPVGSFEPNPFDLYDMAGNVYEWCLDHEHDSYIGAPTDGSTWANGPHPDNRVTRGGSWNLAPTEFDAANRCFENRILKANDHGFRVVMEP